MLDRTPISVWTGHIGAVPIVSQADVRHFQNLGIRSSFFTLKIFFVKNEDLTPIFFLLNTTFRSLPREVM